MTVETVDTLVIGAGQAGVAMSEHLGRRGVPHLVLERKRIAERWRTERWDSLVANGPAWHDRFPNMTFPGIDPDGFAPHDAVADYLEAYARRIEAPVRCGVSVRSVRPDGDGFVVDTSHGVVRARNVVAATGPFQKPIIPDVIPADAGVTQLHSNTYHNPEQLPPGGVLVIGAGSSGTQIADELRRAGRAVWLSVGPHDRPPRRYRGKDFVWWLGKLGMWDMEVPDAGSEHVTIAVSGARGGETVDFRRLATEGMTLVGRTERFSDGVLHFAPDLKTNIDKGDANYLSMLDAADAYIEREGLDFPEEPDARIIGADPACVAAPLRTLDLKQAGIGTVLWATGYALDFGWIEADTFDPSGRPRHKKGVSDQPGLYFVGLSWLTRRASAFIWGVWHDADYLAGHIAARGQR
ncbi:flavin-containing monooxygenase [Ameyamaea chiangmaiensis NBRC 103196]|uniref:NAD(P)-binding domain-containing protein n=1 Tax=Ameyamaea chiangmaiensis TaxID=442969 RepID=A0A850PD18_9PROT|nr:NAD(P)/FAD-dependent oxidoreductase [Ameyamaea chiangmaiensis]MBS4076387.1 NAD(P)-binding domain-containing protein [Ameyamaea chiangmaiensis]NVN40793.1 NAD(P)-binding domain-containing protein [Ameyamaea chiangmaiensis]GBQ63481.1 flavin-containing monooxygenase [Ameyamaea chiangmaiensis NBRC 103196]